MRLVDGVLSKQKHDDVHGLPKLPNKYRSCTEVRLYNIERTQSRMNGSLNFLWPATTYRSHDHQGRQTKIDRTFFPILFLSSLCVFQVVKSAAHASTMKDSAEWSEERQNGRHDKDERIRRSKNWNLSTVIILISRLFSQTSTVIPLCR